MGVQLIGRPGGEAVLFALAAQLERRVRRGQRHPPELVRAGPLTFAWTTRDSGVQDLGNAYLTR